jgi:hypothetical protein
VARPSHVWTRAARDAVADLRGTLVDVSEDQGFDNTGPDPGAADNPYAPPPPGWQPPPAPPQPPYAPPPAYGPPPPPPYAAPPGWQPTAAPPGAAGPYGSAPPYASAPPPYGSPPQPYGAAGWPAGYPGYGYSAPQSTNGFAVAALVCSIVIGWIPYVGAVLGVVFGIIGLRQCRRTGARGHGLAIAGIVIGSVGIVLWTLLILLAAVYGGSSTPSNGNLGALSLALGR